MNKNYKDKQEILERVCKNVVEESYGCWISMIYYRDYGEFDWLGEPEDFLAILTHLLENKKIVFFPPEEFYNYDVKNYNTPIIEKQGFRIWNLPIENMISYIRKHLSNNINNSNDVNDDNIPYWYTDYCPRVGWINEKTGKIEMGF